MIFITYVYTFYYIFISMKIDVPLTRLQRVPKHWATALDRRNRCDCDTRCCRLLSAVRAIFSRIISSALIKISALSSQTASTQTTKQKSTNPK